MILGELPINKIRIIVRIICFTVGICDLILAAIRMRKGVTNEVLLDVIFGMALLQMCQDNTVVINM